MYKKIPWLATLLPVLFLQMAVCVSVNCQDVQNQDYELIAPLPPSLLSNDGRIIEDARDWEQLRREELLELFRSHVYGRVPEAEFSLEFSKVFQDSRALGGSAVMKEVEVSVHNGDRELDFSILIFLPADAEGAVPLFLGLNFHGNHTIHPCEEISIPDSWVRNNPGIGVQNNRALAESRGSSASRWPVEMILERGYGVATIYCGDIDPDIDDGFENGIHGVLQEEGEMRGPGSWGTITAWAWGLSRAMDYLETDPDIDHERVAVIGHSRLGKTSLWAGALDERFAMVVSNNSGCGGAALSRRPFGERVSDINQSFPHWFAGKFHEYNDNEAACPVDQHMLLSLVAPRPLYVASATGDEWADPRGEYLSLLSSSEVYKLYEKDVLVDLQSPEADQPRLRGKQAYHRRSGKHDIRAYDWEQYLNFADRHLSSVHTDSQHSPVSMEWIRDHLSSEKPCLVLTPELEAGIRQKLEMADPHTTMGFQLLEKRAKALLEGDVLSYDKEGRRLLGVSREALRRITNLSLAYRFDNDQAYLDQLERELDAVCSFEDWNPGHFLDVAEMAAAVALGLDWAGEYMSPETNALAKKALVEKALKPGLAASDNNFWREVDHNWNLVCNFGLSLAALVVFEDEPELASAILRLALETIPRALHPYAPDGIYPEGVSYWSYATSYLTLGISAFESALGTDFGLTAYPGVLKSKHFSMLMAGPSGRYYNFFDSSEGGFLSLGHLGLMAWFSKRSGEGLDLQAYEQLLAENLVEKENKPGGRLYGINLLALSSVNPSIDAPYAWPESWWGGGAEPIAVIRDRDNHPDAFFMAAKGGMAGDNHGNMDAGSFIFELNGIRWSVDPGNQNYHTLEQIMGTELWENGQDSQRWTLLTKSNSGHSTLAVNGQRHLVDGRVELIRSDTRSGQAVFTFDLSPLYGQNIHTAHRTFFREASSLVIRDELMPSSESESFTWQMLTRAEVETEDEILVLSQGGKKLYLTLESDLSYELNIVVLSPPPLSYDKDIPGLKRIEIVYGRGIPADSCTINAILSETRQ